MGLKSFPDNNVKEKIWGVNMCFGQYKSGKRKVRYIVSTMYYKKKYSITRWSVARAFPPATS